MNADLAAHGAARVVGVGALKRKTNTSETSNAALFEQVVPGVQSLNLAA
jgi:hypothetical protein